MSVFFGSSLFLSTLAHKFAVLFATTTAITVEVYSEFASTFGRFYQLHDTTDYPETNPMLKAETFGAGLHSMLGSVKFPIRYKLTKRHQG